MQLYLSMIPIGQPIATQNKHNTNHPPSYINLTFILTIIIQSIIPTNDLVNMSFSKKFPALYNHPAKIYCQSSTIIDSILTNMIDSKIIYGNILTHIPEHFPQFLILRNANICYNYRGSFKYDYSIFDETNFINDF